jgi:hypothetical protein
MELSRSLLIAQREFIPEGVDRHILVDVSQPWE